MSLIRSLKDKYIRQVIAPKALRQLNHLRTDNTALGTAVRNWMRHDNTLTKHMGAIESQRERWLSDDRPLDEIAEGFNSHHTVKRACQASKPRIWCELLAEIAVLQQSNSILELGTNLGISSAYLASAVQDHGGMVVTMEGAESRLALARELHESLDLDNIRYIKGRFDKTLPGTLETLPPIDLAFIDGHHQYRPTLDYFDLIHPHLSDSALVIFDDINWSKGMVKVWSELQNDPRFAYTIQIGGAGICETVQNTGKRNGNTKLTNLG